jgi:outer membrane protein OmpA-like peptidoglycan-associated protein
MILALTAVVAPACATKKYVRTEVDAQVTAINGTIHSLQTALEETQERTRVNEEQIGQVGVAAASARHEAAEAQSTASSAATAVQEVGTRVDSIETAERRLVYEVTLTEQEGNFVFGRATLPDGAAAALDAMIQDLQAHPRDVVFEIEGYTDNVGPHGTNERLGRERADTVMRYLHERHQVPLNKMNVISYGMERPVASNGSRIGRAMNRRVVIKVLA